MKQRAPKRPASERKQMIIEGAQSVFAESGYANSGTEDVARAAGIAPSAIYRHFASKRELYLAALKDAGPRLLSIWAETSRRVADPRELLWRMGLDYYDHVQGRSTYARLWFQALGDVSDPGVRSTLAGNFTLMVDGLEAHLKEGQENGFVRREIDARMAAWQFMAIGLSFDLIHHLGLGRELNREKVEAWGRLFVESISEEAHAAASNSQPRPGAEAGALPLRQSRRHGLPAGSGNPLPPLPADPPDSLGARDRGGAHG